MRTNSIASSANRFALAALISLSLFSCNRFWSVAESYGYCRDFNFGLSPGMAAPQHPQGNCVTEQKVALGRRLFYDRRLSENQKQSCSSCHIQRLGFSDGRVRAIGSTGETHPRNALTLANIANFSTLTWFSPDVVRLENQTLIPFFAVSSQTTILELGITGKEHVIIERIQQDAVYPRMFEEAFPGSPVDISHVARALEAFEMTLLSYKSPFDLGKMSEPAKRGEKVFYSERGGCFHCHGGRDFNLDDRENRLSFQNIGLYNVHGSGDYPDQMLHGDAAQKSVQGLFLITGKKEDRGRFRTPSLRNIEVSAPYMHDGSVASLAGVIEIFNEGGRNVRWGPLAGDGRKNPEKDSRVRPLGLSEEEKSDLIAFLLSLTDENFLNDSRFSDPAVTASFIRD